MCVQIAQEAQLGTVVDGLSVDVQHEVGAWLT